MLFARIGPPHAPQTLPNASGEAFWTSPDSILEVVASPPAPLGGILGVLERFLAASRALLGVFWLILGASCMHLGSWGRPRPRFWSLQG